MKLPGEGLKRVGGDAVVAVNKQQPFAPGGLDAGVARRAQAAVLLVDHPDQAQVGGGVVVAQRAAFAVGGAVVHQNDLIVLQLLGKDGGHTGPQIVGHVVDRDHDAKSHTYPFNRNSSRSRR